MEKYNIDIKQSAIKELNKIPARDLKKIASKIESLSHNPRPAGCEKLSAQERYRLRQGNYRILYSIEDDILTVYVVKIAHRKDVYR
ncbi:MAG: type II toxin-antitoxin system RelE/ParE family toxin [Dehalococcoidia bacterium]|jgi:mRNA interferase RelE/StbE